MKTAIYFLVLLVFVALITGFLIANQGQMSMGQISLVSAGLVIYTVALSLVGEGKSIDEREIYHRRISARIGFITGVSVLSLGLIYQLYTHQLDYWLLGGLIIINLSKIISLIWLNTKK